MIDTESIEKCKLIQGDCLEKMKELPDNSVDLVLTDPPYGINYKSNHGSKKYRNRLMNFEWDKNFDLTHYHISTFTHSFL